MKRVLVVMMWLLAAAVGLGWGLSVVRPTEWHWSGAANTYSAANRGGRLGMMWFSREAEEGELRSFGVKYWEMALVAWPLAGGGVWWWLMDARRRRVRGFPMEDVGDGRSEARP